MYLSYWGLKLSTVDEFTISSVRSFHLFTTLTQNEFILKDLRALGFISVSCCDHVFVSQWIQKVHPSEYHQYYVGFQKTPKSFSLSTNFNTVIFPLLSDIYYSNRGLSLPMCITLHLSMLNNINNFMVHWHTLFKSSRFCNSLYM